MKTLKKSIFILSAFLLINPVVQAQDTIQDDSGYVYFEVTHISQLAGAQDVTINGAGIEVTPDFNVFEYLNGEGDFRTKVEVAAKNRVKLNNNRVYKCRNFGSKGCMRGYGYLESHGQISWAEPSVNDLSLISEGDFIILRKGYKVYYCKENQGIIIKEL